ncbi:MAG: IPT/TIG domain-containing protein [Bacteroidota bacterium]
MKKHLIYSATILLVVLLAVSCKEDPPASLWVPNPPSGLQPTVTSIAPPDSALAGVSVVAITGTNFLPDTLQTFVFFDDKRATILEASTTQLRVKAPNLVKDTVMLKVAVQGASLFSEPVRYKLIAAVSEFGVTPNVVEAPYGLACNRRGDLFVSFLSAGGTGLGVKRFSSTGVRKDYAAIFSTPVNNWTSLKVGPGDTIYAAANRNALFMLVQLGPDTARAVPYANVGPAGTQSVYDFDFDQNKNFWVSGGNNAVYRVRRSDRNVRVFPFAGDVRSVRVFNGYLYLGARSSDSHEKVVRFPIVSADSLGPSETYFDLTLSNSSASVYAITFAADGDMFVGTDSLAGSIVVVHSNGTSEPLYPGLFKGKSIAFAYGVGTELFVSRSGSSADEKRIIRVNTQKLSAPYYGRQ